MAQDGETIGNGMSQTESAESIANSLANATRSDPMDQVRELLFGETKRETQTNLRAVETRLDDVRADLLERISLLEARLVELARDTETNRANTVNAIGDAISQLGASIQAMSGKRN